MYQREVPSQWIQITACVLYSLLTLFGLITNGLLAIALVVGYRRFSSPFYLLARHILLAHLMCLMDQGMVVVPHTLFPSLTHTSLIYQYPVIIDSLGQVASIHFSLLQALSLVIVPLLGNTWVCITMWMANSAFLLLFYYANCAKQFHPYLLHFQHFCDFSARGIWVTLNIWLATVLLVCLAIYVVALKTKCGNTKEKSSLLIQGFLVSLTNYGQLVLGLAMPWLTTQPGLNVDVIAGGCVLSNCLVLVCLASNPLIYCMFNKKIRRIFSRLCSCWLIVKDPKILLRSNSTVSRY